MPNNNDLVARYLQAVGFWLPRATRHDILAEISEDLHSQIDDRAASLGRPLTENEVADILKQRGRPAVVAGTFLPQHQLIGPVMFPIYIFVLKIVALCYLLPWLLVWLGFLIFDRSHLVRHAGGAFQALGTFWTLLWTVFGAITFIFAMLDRTSQRAKFMNEWDPHKLPKINRRQPNRKAQDIAAIVFGILGLCWLLAIPTHPLLMLGPAAYFIHAASVWRSVYPIIIILSIAGIAEAAVSLTRNLPLWEPPAFRIVNNCVVLWLISILLHTRTYFVASAPQMQQYASIANLVALICILGTALGLVISLFFEAWRLLQALLRRPEPAVPRIA